MRNFYMGLFIFSLAAGFLVCIIWALPQTLLAASPVAAMDPAGYPAPVFGTAEYKSYTRSLMQKFPDNFPTELKQVPETDVAKLKENPF